ncbi:hypothetical protein Ga0466249_000952 [Sporomusaceae bacterium BoRhaA]|nr:hypothetical protein [Pelorhabdus rhamnosifermentans]
MSSFFCYMTGYSATEIMSAYIGLIEGKSI